MTFTKRISTSLILATAPIATVFAQQNQVPINSKEQLLQTIRSIINWFAVLFFTLAVVFILWAGWLYLRAATDEDALKKAKDQLIYASVAIVIGAIAYSFPDLIISFLR